MSNKARNVGVKHVEIINRFGVREFAAELGLEYETVRRMRDRHRIAVEHWPRLIEAAHARGWVDVTAESLLLGLVRDAPAGNVARPSARVAA